MNSAFQSSFIYVSFWRNFCVFAEARTLDWWWCPSAARTPLTLTHDNRAREGDVSCTRCWAYASVTHLWFCQGDIESSGSNIFFWDLRMTADAASAYICVGQTPSSTLPHSHCPHRHSPQLSLIKITPSTPTSTSSRPKTRNQLDQWQPCGYATSSAGRSGLWLSDVRMRRFVHLLCGNG